MRIHKSIVTFFLLSLSSASFAATSDWTGFYVGGNLGESIDSTNAQTSMYSNGGVASSSFVANFNAAGQQSLDFNNFIGGLQAGYDYQINHWVVGLEVNYDPATQATGSQTSSVASVPGDYDGNGTSITQTLYQSWDFTVRPRVGYVINKFLFYVSGGFALAKINYSSATDWNNTDGDLINNNTTISAALPGWTVGAGVEWKFVPNHWSLDTQYLYQGFEQFSSTNSITSTNLIQPDPNAAVSQKGIFSSNVLMVGINYIF